MSTNHSTKKSRYSHLSASERGEISAYLKMGKKPAEIARLLNRHRSTITREIKRGTVTQVQDKNGKQRTYYPSYFADSGQCVYEDNRKRSVYLKLNQCSPTFFNKLEEAVKANIRRHSVDTFVQEYKAKHPTEIVPSTKTVYRYILSGLISIKPIDLPKMVNIRKRTRTKTTVNKKTLGKSIEERPETVDFHAKRMKKLLFLENQIHNDKINQSSTL